MFEHQDDEFVISMRQLATVILKYGGRRMASIDKESGNEVWMVDYSEIDPHETVELKQLVRCGSCSHYTGGDANLHSFCSLWADAVEPEGYCSYAELRKDG